MDEETLKNLAEKLPLTSALCDKFKKLALEMPDQCPLEDIKNFTTLMMGELAALSGSLELKNERMKTALEKIEKWFGEFPATENFWPAREGNDPVPMSYGACFGSNGERDYMREIARKALKNE